MTFFSFCAQLLHFPSFTCDLSRDLMVFSFSMVLLLFVLLSSLIFNWLLSWVYKFLRLILVKNVLCFFPFICNVEGFVLFGQLLYFFIFHALSLEFGEYFDLSLFLLVPFHGLLDLLQDGLGLGLLGGKGTYIPLACCLL